MKNLIFAVGSLWIKKCIFAMGAAYFHFTILKRPQLNLTYQQSKCGNDKPNPSYTQHVDEVVPSQKPFKRLRFF